MLTIVRLHCPHDNSHARLHLRTPHQGKVLLGGATFACLLMLKHLFLALAPLYFVYLLRSYCCCHCERAQARADDAIMHDGGDRVGVSGGGGGKRSKGRIIRKTPSRGGHKDPQQASLASASGVLEHSAQHEGARTAVMTRLSWTRFVSLGFVVLCVFGSVLAPVCMSDGLTKEACLKQLGQLGVRLFPFGRRVWSHRPQRMCRCVD